MKNYLKIGIFAALVIGMVIMTGCTNAGTTTPSSQTTTVSIVTTAIPIASIPATTQPSQIQTSSPEITTITTTIPVSQVTTILADAPHISNLQFRTNYLTTPIDNCPMQEAFPIIAKDPTYGLLKTPPKITALSAGEWRTFIRDYMEGANENSKMVGVSRCQGAVVDPKWNFVEVRAMVIPTNGRPANYTVSLNIRSQGKIIAQFKTTELLTLDQMIEFISYVPLTRNDIESFDSVDITYTKLPN